MANYELLYELKNLYGVLNTKKSRWTLQTAYKCFITNNKFRKWSR
jgi:hypothetical protein